MQIWNMKMKMGVIKVIYEAPQSHLWRRHESLVSFMCERPSFFWQASLPSGARLPPRSRRRFVAVPLPLRCCAAERRHPHTLPPPLPLTPSPPPPPGTVKYSASNSHVTNYNPLENSQKSEHRTRGKLKFVSLGLLGANKPTFSSYTLQPTIYTPILLN